jgi:hypothetical protein
MFDLLRIPTSTSAESIPGSWRSIGPGRNIERGREGGSRDSRKENYPLEHRAPFSLHDTPRPPSSGPEIRGSEKHANSVSNATSWFSKDLTRLRASPKLVNVALILWEEMRGSYTWVWPSPARGAVPSPGECPLTRALRHISPALCLSEQAKLQEASVVRPGRARP